MLNLAMGFGVLQQNNALDSGFREKESLGPLKPTGKQTALLPERQKARRSGRAFFRQA